MIYHNVRECECERQIIRMQQRFAVRLRRRQADFWIGALVGVVVGAFATMVLS